MRIGRKAHINISVSASAYKGTSSQDSLPNSGTLLRIRHQSRVLAGLVAGSGNTRNGTNLLQFLPPSVGHTCKTTLLNFLLYSPYSSLVQGCTSSNRTRSSHNIRHLRPRCHGNCLRLQMWWIQTRSIICSLHLGVQAVAGVYCCLTDFILGHIADDVFWTRGMSRMQETLYRMKRTAIC